MSTIKQLSNTIKGLQTNGIYIFLNQDKIGMIRNAMIARNAIDDHFD
jgi:hypothetical protein